LAVQFGGLPVQLAQPRVGRAGHQVLGAFGGSALAAGLLARAVAELLRTLSPLTMLLGPWSGHAETVPRTPPSDAGPPGIPAASGESTRVTLTADRRPLACFDGDAGRWRIDEGTRSTFAS
jgi:hypothetical protein